MYRCLMLYSDFFMRNDATQKYAKTIFEFSLTYFIGLSNVYNNTAAT